jgi:hypothetical protein
MSLFFLSFADSRYKRSLARIAKQAQSFNIFEGITVADENCLEDSFRYNFKEKLVSGTRGYGYWCWKPQIILQELKKLSDGDMLLYVDAGCHLNPNGRDRLLEYFEALRNASSGIIAFQAKKPVKPLIYDGRQLFDYPNYMWTKGDLLDYFGVRDDEEILNSQTIGAGIILVKKCDKSIEILKKWMEVYSYDFRLIDDSPSRSQNPVGFVEHRHDQAIFSILCLQNSVETISAYEYYYPKEKSTRPDWIALENFPIHARRDKKRGYFIDSIILIGKMIMPIFKERK